MKQTSPPPLPPSGKPVITVERLMSRDIKTLRRDNTLRDAINLFHRENLGYLPVVSSDMTLEGELSVLDLFASCVPDYARRLGNLRFTRAFDPFADLLDRGEHLPVGELMRPAAEILTEDDTVMEAVMAFCRHKRHHLPVVKNGILVGVVSYTDILQKVLAA
jgi:acetoin utilization protein AcuB